MNIDIQSVHVVGWIRTAKVNCKFLENVVKLKYFRIVVTNGNYRHEDIKSRLNFMNSCCLLNYNLPPCCRD
jgi:hypothetical protein